MSVPVFVKIEDYEEVRKLIDSIKEKISEARSVLDKISELKEEENKEVESWKFELSSIENRLGAIDRDLSTPEQG